MLIAILCFLKHFQTFENFLKRILEILRNNDKGKYQMMEAGYISVIYPLTDTPTGHQASAQN